MVRNHGNSIKHTNESRHKLPKAKSLTNCRVLYLGNLSRLEDTRSGEALAGEDDHHLRVQRLAFRNKEVRKASERVIGSKQGFEGGMGTGMGTWHTLKNLNTKLAILNKGHTQIGAWKKVNLYCQIFY